MVMPGYLHTGRGRIGNLHFSIMTAVGKYTLCMLMDVCRCMDKWMRIGHFPH